LAGFKVEPVKEPLPFTTVLDEQAFFYLRCSCSSAALCILGYPIAEVAGYLSSPLSVQCEACGRITPLFDSREHGYDAEQGSCYSIPSSGEPQRFVCPQCSGMTFAAYPAFTYQLEGDDFAPEQWAHIQDFFDWFVLNVRCKNCGALCTAAEYECA
jgi:hypothetical protein